MVELLCNTTGSDESSCVRTFPTRTIYLMWHCTPDNPCFWIQVIFSSPDPFFIYSIHGTNKAEIDPVITNYSYLLRLRPRKEVGHMFDRSKSVLIVGKGMMMHCHQVV